MSSLSAAEGCSVPDSENIVVKDKCRLERTSKGWSMGSVTRKKLADISNLPQRSKPSQQDDKSRFISTAKERIDQLQKENMGLVKFLADRNKIIEMSGTELQQLRINLRKVQQQNLQLAQANSKLLAELNSGKDRLKALQHELGCKNCLLKARELELEEKAKKRICRKNEIEGAIKCEESSQADIDHSKPSNTSRRQSKSVGPSAIKHVQAKEKAEDKRPCVRRQSARFKTEEPVHAEDLFVAAGDAKFPVCSPQDDEMQENCSTSMRLSVKKEDKGRNSTPSYEAQEIETSAIGRPSRLAAQKVQSYKEIPLNVKMRRQA